MICSCGNTFAPTAETFYDAQFFPALHTGEPVWLYTVLHRCPACSTLRSLVMFDATGGDEEDLEAAALVDYIEPLFSAERYHREIAAEQRNAFERPPVVESFPP